MNAAEFTTESPAQTEALAARLAALLRPGDCVALEGELGAGKTCFVRGLARAMGHAAAMVSSPTFVLMHEYTSGSGGDGQHGGAPPIPLIHVDAYRITGPEDLETLALDQITGDGDAVLVVEWPERIEAALPMERFRVRLEHAAAPDQPQRRITIEAPPGRSLVPLGPSTMSR